MILADHAPKEPGLSPRMRGNQNVTHTRRIPEGSIPAHAGEPVPHAAQGHIEMVYPRACGGTPAGVGERGGTWGLSPRMRGNRPLPAHFRPQVGSIPAHAGEPRLYGTARTIAGVYPRACGGTIREHVVTGTMEVYPRACGGTPAQYVAAVIYRGLSPRMRGNLLWWMGSSGDTGSIPAHAGEPRSGSLSCWCGLSPRMRGNHAHVGSAFATAGSIPAHAGEPPLGQDKELVLRVYPRACGGTGRCINKTG